MVASGHTYRITNKQSGTSCDLSGQDQTSVIGFPPHGGDNQKWKVQDTGNGWTLQNVYNQKYLSTETNPSGADPDDGTKVVATETNSPPTWDIRPEQNDDSAYRIFSRKKANMNVDLADHGDPKPGTPVTMWSQWDGQNQVWRFEEV